MATPENRPAWVTSWFQSHQRTAWLPIIKPTDALTGGSKYAGVPWLAHDEEWPACESCRRPMQFFFQLDLGCLPEGANRGFGDGLLQLFMCTWIQQGKCQPIRDPCLPFSDATLIRIIPAQGAGKAVEIPFFGEGLSSADVPGNCMAIRGWEAQTDFPRSQEFEDHHPHFRGDEDLFSDSFSCTQDDKLGGWPFWLQGTEYHHCRRCRTPMTNLIYQLRSDHILSYWFGRAGIGWILQCPKDKDILAFTWQC
ncbi:MAG: DUF1963 domain-containing protein [Planctomycetia bacterium]|nr:DUF1963 domain-containing protein [Planctomycetia bacterium]